MTRLSEHSLRVSDVLCLSAVTIHGLVLEWLDAEGRPGREWVSPARALKLPEAHQLRERAPGPEQQHANTHGLFIKLSAQTAS